MSDAELRIDDFQLVNLIASGHSSQVWEVADAGGQSFAMKLLLSEAFKSQDQVNVLKHEAKVGQQLDHPNLIHTHRFVKTKTHCYMLMELFRSPSLKQLLKSEPIAAQARFTRLVEQLCLALGCMHEKGWLHHDLKPDNILFSKASELKLIDFSLAMKRQSGVGKMFAGKVKVVQGTRTYIAPETIRKQYPTIQSDIYSLGVTLFEVLTGQPPFVANSPNDLLVKHLSAKAPEPSAFNPNVTPEVDKFILRLLSKKPAHRPKDLAEVSAEFRSLKVFHRDPMELAAEEEAQKKAEGLGLSAKSRLDSRADAERTAAGIAPPPRPEPRKPTAAALKAGQAGSGGGQSTAPTQQPIPGQQPAHPGYDPAAAWAAYAQQGYAQGQWPQYGPQQPAQGYYPYPHAGHHYPPPDPNVGGSTPQAPGHAPPQGAPQVPPQQWSQPAAPPPSSQPPSPPQPAAPVATPPPAQPSGRPDESSAHPGEQSSEPPKPNVPPQAPTPPAPTRTPIYLPGMGRANDKKHPTQENIDPDDLPLMDVDELPEVL